MGLFNSKKEGGIRDSIRCDEREFMIWKWRPDRTAGVGESRKENGIRNGSSLSVRLGQAAVFYYPNGNNNFDIITGAYNGVVNTDNMPVLATLVGSLFAGGAPYPAEVYFVNQETNMEVPFYIDFFRVSPAEEEYRRMNIQVSVKGSLSFEIGSSPEEIMAFVSKWGSNDITKDEFEEKLRTMLMQDVKQQVSRAPMETGIFVLEFNNLLSQLGPYILHGTDGVRPTLYQNILSRFGVKATGVFISEIRYEENSDYQMLREMNLNVSQYTLEQQRKALLGVLKEQETLAVDADVRNATTIRTAQTMMDHQEDQLARMREEGQYAQHKQTDAAFAQSMLGSQSAYINAHALNQQTEVMKTGLENMGGMGAMNLGGGEGHMNPAGMMTGMMMGASVAGQMGNMMNQMGGMMRGNMAQAGAPQQAPPPLPNQQAVAYYVYLNGQQVGPAGIQAIAQMVSSGQVNGDTLAWCNGMANWTPMKDIPALASLFNTGSVPPPVPGMPPVPPVPPTV